jgi:hypothetical protein
VLSLLEHLDRGATVDEFLEWFPEVTRAQVHELLEFAKAAGASSGCRVKILFDTNTPAPLAHGLRGHEVMRTGELGWHRLENGALLSAAETAGFEVLVTCDQNVPLQQT